jgi:hypothetical protein
LGGLPTTTCQPGRSLCSSCQPGKPRGCSSCSVASWYIIVMYICWTTAASIHLTPTMADLFGADDEVESVLFVQREISGRKQYIIGKPLITLLQYIVSPLFSRWMATRLIHSYLWNWNTKHEP